MLRANSGCTYFDMFNFSICGQFLHRVSHLLACANITGASQHRALHGPREVQRPSIRERCNLPEETQTTFVGLFILCVPKYARIGLCKNDQRTKQGEFNGNSQICEFLCTEVRAPWASNDPPHNLHPPCAVATRCLSREMLSGWAEAPQCSACPALWDLNWFEVTRSIKNIQKLWNHYIELYHWILPKYLRISSSREKGVTTNAA